MSVSLLVVGHGSREAAGNAEIEQVAAQRRQRQPQWHIEVCCIEFADVLLADGLSKAARHAGQTGEEKAKVVILPLILNAASHVKEDIPQAIAAAQQQYPQVQFLCAPHLGACDAVLAVLQRKLHAAMQTLDMPDPHSTGVVLLGRGSSDMLANGEVAKMARWLFECSGHELVDVAFTGVTFPRLERVVQRQVQWDMKQIVVLPYYLFNGVLMQRIGRQMQHLQQQYPHIRFAHSAYFGFEPEIYQVLEQNANAILSEQANSCSNMPAFYKQLP